jgi:hypothetical protein
MSNSTLKPKLDDVLNQMVSAFMLQPANTRRLTLQELVVCLAVASHIDAIRRGYGSQTSPMLMRFESVEQHMRRLLEIAVEQGVEDIGLDEVLTLPEPFRACFTFLRFVYFNLADADPETPGLSLINGWDRSVGNWDNMPDMLEKVVKSLFNAFRNEVNLIQDL